jgi:hypothetical protein
VADSLLLLSHILYQETKDYYPGGPKAIVSDTLGVVSASTIGVRETGAPGVEKEVSRH